VERCLALITDDDELMIYASAPRQALLFFSCFAKLFSMLRFSNSTFIHGQRGRYWFVAKLQLPTGDLSGGERDARVGRT
jgi:hypothetical protein